MVQLKLNEDINSTKQKTISKKLVNENRDLDVLKSKKKLFFLFEYVNDLTDSEEKISFYTFKLIIFVCNSNN